MASSFQGKPLTAEQVRTNFRKSLRKVADPLIKATIVDAIPGDDDNLLPSDKNDSGIRVEIAEWPERDFTNLSSTLRLEIKFSDDTEYVPVGEPEEVPNSKPSDEFPHETVIPLDTIKNHEGTFWLRYRVTYWNSEVGESIETPVTRDTLGPLQPNEAPKAMIIAEPLITDATLLRDGGVKCVVPPFVEDKKEFVKVAVGWMDKIPEDESEFPDLVAFFDLLPQPSQEVTVPANWITDLGSKTQYAVYFLFDKAGNRSQMSLPKTVGVALGTLPADMEVCEVPLEKQDGLYDRADAGILETVVIEDYTGSDKDDGIVIKWHNATLARTSVGAHMPFPLTIKLPWSVKRDQYNFAGTQLQTIDVDYIIYRGDEPFPSPGVVKVNTDYKIAGPENPDPGPINPDLELIVFESSEGSATELIPDDNGNDATGHIKLFDLPVPQVGDFLTLVYNGTPVLPPYEIKAGDTPGKVIPYPIPWTGVIEKTMVMDQLPMYYTLTRTGLNNPQESLRTFIDVTLETVDLPEPEFLDPANPDPSKPLTILNCRHLREVNGTWGYAVHIPKSTYLKAGEWITLSWMSFAQDSTTPIDGTDHNDRFQIDANQEANGIDWLIPNDKCLAPVYRPPVASGGYGKVIYSIDVRGTARSSDLVSVIIGMFEEYPPGSGNGHCKLTRPPRV